MKTLVTGSSGHVGGTIAARLIELGWEVWGLDCRPAGIRGLAGHVLLDIASHRACSIISDRIPICENVIHAAAVIQPDLYNESVVLTNCLGTQQLLKLAREWRVGGFIHLSSVPVIGRPGRLPVTEEHPVNPLTAYHASKIFGEHLVRLSNQPGVMTTASFRLTSPVGPGTPSNRIFSVFTDNAAGGRPIRIDGSGTRRQNYVDVRDIARAVELCLNAGASGLFNIAGKASVSNRELAEICKSVLKSSAPVVFSKKPDPDDGVNWDVSTEKARRSFGYEPLYRIEDSVRDYIAAGSGLEPEIRVKGASA